MKGEDFPEGMIAIADALPTIRVSSRDGKFYRTIDGVEEEIYMGVVPEKGGEPGPAPVMPRRLSEPMPKQVDKGNILKRFAARRRR